MPSVTPTACAVAALSVTQLIGWGASFYLPAVTAPAMAADIDVSVPWIMAGPTIMLLVMAAASWPLAGLFERHGARWIMTVSSPLGALGLLLIAVSQGPVLYLCAWLVIGLAGSGMLTTPAQIAVTEIAGERARRALGILILAGGLTSTIIWPLTGILQAHFGWRLTTGFYAALMLLVCMPLHWLTLARLPAGAPARKRPKGQEEGQSPEGEVDAPRFLLLAATFAANGFVTWGFALTIIILFEADGLDHASALSAAALIGMAQWSGRLLDFVGGKRWSGFASGLVATALFPLSFVILLLANGFYGAAAFALLYGFSSGITAVARATLPLEIFPAGAYARASAGLAVPLNISFAAAPPIFAAIVGTAGPHAALWLALVISTLAFCSLSALYLRQRRMTG